MKFLLICFIFIVILIIRYKIKNKRKYNKQIQLFYSTNDYPILKIIDFNWRIISQETKRLSNNIIANIDINFLKKKNYDNYCYILNLFNDNYGWLNITQGNFNNNNNYLYWPLIYNGQMIIKNFSFCTNSCLILSKISNIKNAGFSILKANSFYYPRKYTGGNSINYLIGLNISESNNCKFYCNEYVINVKNGKSFLFNPAFKNYEINDGNDDRIL